MHLRLIIAETLPAVSGAAFYDHRIADALRALGHSVAITTKLTFDTPVLIDGSALLACAGELSQATALIHHPLCLETAPPDAAMKAAETDRFAAVRHIITTSAQTAERLAADFAVPPEKISVIVPGIGDLPRAIGSQTSTCHILSVGQLIPRKGHDLLLKAIARLFDLDWHLTIVGGANDPVHANGLQALAQDLNIAQHVSFTGAVTGDALDALWQSADMFALTPHYEGYGMVYAEALRRGLPILATATGVAPELVDWECGAVCPIGDLDQISKALRRLIFDKTLRHDIAETAWRAGQALPSWRDQAEKLVAVMS